MSTPDILAALALDLGFDAVGWSAAHVPDTSVEEYARWLKHGHHAGMDYLERQLPRRADLSSSLEGSLSVLVLGISHAFEQLPPPPGGVRLGRVARYAWTPDYHEQLAPLLSRLETETAKLGGRARAYVDHGPVMERLLGASAFLGWRAKSGMLVSTSLGAFMTLAVVLTDLPLQVETQAHPDRCGRCTRCISACPTQAILPGRALDARRCVSYLTIEHRGPVPWELRSGVGDWLFGCDGCTEVCPWSMRAGSVARALRPQAELAHPDLTPFFMLSGRQFDQAYQGTPFARPRRKGMARNACYVIGNTRDPQGFSLLERAVHDPAWEVREAAAWALGQFGETKLLHRLMSDPHPQVSDAARRLYVPC
ncbi:tRNA epoxyqueuosine(34) reductase QueG [Deinococcus peraridilitoris]|uniref:Uncharacterized Fe-S protein n=1 Tax=Deinococcus peraridilitoris (strain DSM 19664 / LMG 22246 / CIP 109416 / KR-200) TaxID=937777 RepID=K9ZXF1_DEIPD|nr:tRNA epoxyqueuosine(34) reductase QueG [Deinococcus peraridilitoris]AFZ65879.1 uncharacterized Fe-S protein [Deinococcus peraridilitoris DSM 19664]